MSAQRPVADNGTAMGGGTLLLERIEELTTGEAEPEEVERTLTEGYAEALALEAERWRLRRQIGEAAGQLEGDPERVREVSDLAKRLETTDRELTHLRDVLAALRRRARCLGPPLEPATGPSA